VNVKSTIANPVPWDQLLVKYNRSLPRYTSYPTAAEFSPRVTTADYEWALQALDPDAPVSLYAHIPFCEHQCDYCGCFVIPTARRSAASAYLHYLIKEVALVARKIGRKQKASAIHLGGGTPTYLSPTELEELLCILRGAFEVEANAEVSAELDPRVTQPEHIDALERGGMNRVSIGVQDTSSTVQEAIGRHQTKQQTVDLIRLLRERGFRGVNVDLIYGLPRQTRESFRCTLEDMLSLRPDRIAVFGYAHVPSIRPNQAKIDASSLPGLSERLDLYLMAQEVLRGAGYNAIGLDHFALPEDSLARALRGGSLVRNFMGYSAAGETTILGFGVSSIGATAAAYFQNEKKLSSYYKRLEQGELATERGFLLMRDDEVRRFVIHSLFTQLSVDHDEFLSRFAVRFELHFSAELSALSDLAEDGLVEIRPGALVVTETGRPFLRSIATVFDTYMRRAGDEVPKHSKAV